MDRVRKEAYLDPCPLLLEDPSWEPLYQELPERLILVLHSLPIKRPVGMSRALAVIHAEDRCSGMVADLQEACKA